VLVRKGAKVKVYDPFFSPEEITKMGYNTSESLEKAISDADCILINTGHDQFRKIWAGRAYSPIRRKGKPYLGICLGLQILFSESEEFGSHQGLNLIKGKVVNSKPIQSIRSPIWVGIRLKKGERFPCSRA
jgi:imidazoleglycerol phosphate synthase glutamine amidotransferase subunit HisH